MMDRFGGFDHKDGGGSHDATHAGIDNPVSIGSDERRMHVRAYNFWVSLLGGRAYPSIEDLDPTQLSDFGTNSVLLDFTEGIDNPGISFIGDALREECELDEKITNVADVPPRSLLSRLTDHYLQIIANRAPIGFEAEFVGTRGTTMLYRGILMPFSSDDDTIDFIYGVINWKEVAGEEGELQLEVEQALADLPQASAPVEAWADGPGHEPDEDVVEVAEPVVVAPVAVAAPVEPEVAVPADLGDDAGLADLLALARETAEAARGADARSRSALYGAIGRAYDFALASEGEQDSYLAILEDSGITQQDRAPMTPVAKLVFGADYDKTRIAEVSAALTHARADGVRRGDMADYIDRYPGGLKGLVAAQRAAKRGQAPAGDVARDAVRIMEAQFVMEFPDAKDEFVVFVGRKLDDGHVGIVAAIEDDASLIDRAVKRAARAKT